MITQSWMVLSYNELADERLPGETEDVHFTESLAAAVVANFSSPGEAVLDPFAGFGTTSAVASRMGRPRGGTHGGLSGDYCLAFQKVA